MNSSQSRFRKILSIIVFISLISGLTVSASAAAGATILESPALCKTAAGASTAPNSTIADCCPDKIAASSESRSAAKPLDDPPCCLPKVVGVADTTKNSTITRLPDCCVGKIAAQETNSSGAKTPIERESCCLPPTKIASNISGDPPPPCPTPEPPAVTSCDLALPIGSVVGEMASDTQVFWAPGKISPDVILTPGRYWVIGEEDADNGDPYYEILLGCEYLFVPEASMQPSYDPPWNGQPLPTTPAI